MALKPRIRTIFLGVNVVVLLVLVGAVGFLRIYQSELIRRTEAELVSQAAMVRAMYRAELGEVLEAGCADAAEYGYPVEIDWPVDIENRFRPIPPKIDLASDTIYPPAPAPNPAGRPPESCARWAGRRVEPMLQEAQTITLSGIHVLDPHGTVVATTQNIGGETLLNRREVERALAGEVVTMVRHREGALGSWSLESIKRRTQMRVFVALPVAHEGRLVGAVALVRTPVSLLKAIWKHRWVFGLFAGAIGLAILVISLVTGYFVGRPIYRLIDQTRRIAREGADATETIRRPGTREVDELSRAFAEMAETLQERNEYIRTFARNVSHELKSPISSIQGTVELLEEHRDEMTDARRGRFHEMLAEDAERMERLVDRLLELARAEVFQPGRERAELAAVFDDLRGRFESLEVEVASEEPGATVSMAPETLDSVFSNLLENAGDHGADRVDITARGSGDGERIVVVVDDDGPGISAGNTDKIFEPFFSADRSEGNTGLGLAIVRALMQAHGGSIELVDGEGGATFRLEVPVERDDESMDRT